MSKFCQKCGSPLNDTTLFCTKCGAKVSEETKAENMYPTDEVQKVVQQTDNFEQQETVINEAVINSVQTPQQSVYTNVGTTKQKPKRKNKKIIVIISAVFVLVVVLAIVSVILFVPKMSGDKELQTTRKINQQMTTENLTTVEPTTVKPSIVAPTTAEPTTVEPTTIKPTKEDENNNSNGSDRCYFDGFSIELPDNFTYEVNDDIVEFFEVYNYEHPKTGSNGYLFSIEKTTKGPADFASATKLGSKDGLNYMLTYPLGMGMIEDEYADQCRRDAINEMNDVIATFRIE